MKRNKFKNKDRLYDISSAHDFIRYLLFFFCHIIIQYYKKKLSIIKWCCHTANLKLIYVYITWHLLGWWLYQCVLYVHNFGHSHYLLLISFDKSVIRHVMKFYVYCMYRLRIFLSYMQKNTPLVSFYGFTYNKFTWIYFLSCCSYVFLPLYAMYNYIVCKHTAACGKKTENPIDDVSIQDTDCWRCILSNEFAPLRLSIIFY